MTDLGSPSLQSLVLTVCVSQSQANARAVQGLRKQLVWVSESGESLSEKCGLGWGWNVALDLETRV